MTTKATRHQRALVRSALEARAEMFSASFNVPAMAAGLARAGCADAVAELIRLAYMAGTSAGALAGGDKLIAEAREAVKP